MRKFLTALVVVPVAILFIVFAVANRHPVTISFDPFNSSDPAIGATLPLFVVLIVVAILGVIAGGIATWIGQRHWRRAARRHEADVRRARSELADLRAEMATATATQRPVPGLPAPYVAGERDKAGATL
ncbi:LapA family protein [Rhodopseudomonas boonkerdii]|uniref:lipopolysaccharide assembly protein LapA domain-containing protein n=1 Tax=Rhodopseudomonas boonkerdii TaxID=475937 RepID=UPI001E65BE69|nr:LapA family protein [Rhodopseudomonas boonkerdii]UGV24530.1 LapA family protein [Rhodopseudomonas boonkerdii]